MSKSVLATTGVLLGAGALVATQLPELRRYLNMRKM